MCQKLQLTSLLSFKKYSLCQVLLLSIFLYIEEGQHTEQVNWFLAQVIWGLSGSQSVSWWGQDTSDGRACWGGIMVFSGVFCTYSWFVSLLNKTCMGLRLLMQLASDLDSFLPTTGCCWPVLRLVIKNTWPRTPGLLLYLTWIFCFFRNAALKYGCE